jgi:hypothetical protein
MKPFGKKSSSASDRPAECRHRPVISYANVAATLALVLSMSGGAYAASKVLTTTKVIVKPSPQLIKALATSPSVKLVLTKEVDSASPELFKVLVSSGALKGVIGSQGPVGAPGTTGQQGTTGQTGTTGLQGPAGPGAVVKSLSISHSSTTPQTLFTYEGDSIGVACAIKGAEASAAFYLEGHATTFWGTETSQTTVDKTTETKTSPLDLSLSQSPSYAPVNGIEISVSSTGQQNSGVYSAQYTALESGALDFHLDLTASIASVNSGVACTFNAAYYPLSTS